MALQHNVLGGLVWLLPLVGIAAPTLLPGEYVTTQGWGVLTVRAGTPMTWSIRTVGSNAHTCQLDGTWKDGVAQLSTDADAPGCRVSFTVSAQGVNVGDNDHESCRYFCGVRAGYTAMYEQPVAACTPSQVRKTRRIFQQVYQQHAYAQAVHVLAPVLAQCARYLTWLDDGWIRNDLGLTQAKLQDKAACQRTLAPLAADAAKRDEVLRDEYPPSDADAWLSVVRAARTNLKKCAALP